MTVSLPLTLLEEFLLLAIDDKTVQLLPLDPTLLNSATAGAVLMDLALRGRIDNDLHDMFAIDSSPTGDDLLDPILRTMATAPVLTPRAIDYWLRLVAEEADSYRDKALSRLQDRGIIRHEEGTYNIFWMMGVRSAPTITIAQDELNAVKSRLARLVLGDEVPTPRDIMLTCLAQACGLFAFFLSESDADDATVRIRQISRMDLVGQAVAKGMAGIQPTFAMAAGDI